MQVKKYAKCVAVAMVVALTTSVYAQAPALGSSDQIIKMAASMNGVAVACKENSQAEVDALYVKQREALLSDGLTAADYDKAYNAAFADFKKRWDSVDSATQQKQCVQIKAMSEQAAAAAKQIEAQMRKK